MCATQRGGEDGQRERGMKDSGDRRDKGGRDG